MLPFSAICDRVARYAQQAIGGNYQQRQITQFVNETYREIWDAEEWPQTRTGPTEITLPANSNTFVLPKNIESVLRAYQGDASGSGSCRFQIRVLGMSEFADATELREGTNNAIWSIAPFGTTGVLAQPASAEILRVASNSATDTSQKVLVKGENATGEIVSELFSLNGTATITGGVSFAVIYNVSKTANTAGTVSVKNHDSTITLATIGPWESSPIYAKYRTDVTPPADITFTIIGKRRFVPMVDKADVAFCDMDLVLVSGAMKRVWMEHREPTLAQTFAAQYENDMAELVRREMNSDGTIDLMVPMLRA